MTDYFADSSVSGGETDFLFEKCGNKECEGHRTKPGIEQFFGCGKESITAVTTVIVQNGSSKIKLSPTKRS